MTRPFELGGGPVRPARTRTVFTTPLRAPDFGAARARKKTQRAGDRLPPVNVPQFPDMKFTPAQRKVVRDRTVKAVRQIAQRRGETAGETARRLYDEGGPQVRKALHLYGRAVAEDNAHVYRTQTGHSTGSVGGDSRALVALGLRSQLRPGERRTGVGAALAPLATVKGYALSPEHNLITAAAPGFGRLGGPVVHDFLSLPRNVAVSTYVTGKALEKAARGHPKELQQLGQTIKNTDPIALAIQGRWNEAAKATGEHPLNTVLELGAARGVLRGAGRLGRISTTREAATLPGTASERAREYTTNPLVKPVQVARDTAKVRKADQLRAEADHLDKIGEPEKADLARTQAARVDPRIMGEHQVQHIADVRESMGQPERRRGRTQIMGEMKPAYVHPREGGHLQRLNVEGSVPIRRVNENGEFDIYGRISVPHMRQDIESKLARLQAEHDAVGPKGKPLMPSRLRRLNRRTAKHLEELKGKTDAQLLNVAHKALDATAITNRVEADVIARKMLDPTEARIARLKTYAFEHMGAKVGRKEGNRHQQLLDEHGRPLSPDRIEAHMRAHGVHPNSVAFVTQRPQGTVGAYNVSWRSAKGANTRTRTGGAVLQGLVDSHPRNLVANAVRLQQLHAANKNWERGLGEVAQRANGRVVPYTSKPSALNAAREIEARTGMTWRPVRMIPWGGREGQLQHMLDHADAEGFTTRNDHPLSQAIEDAVKEQATGEGPWALVPDAWAARIEEHSQVYRSVHPAMRAVNSLFRHTVLPLSLTWLTGNVAEAALRTAVQSPRIAHNLAVYHRVLRALDKIDPEEAAHLRDMVGVGHYGSMEQSNVFTSASQFSTSRFRPIAEALHRFRSTPGPGTLADAYGVYTHFVFEHVNNMLERPFRQAMAGHHIRMALMDSSRAIHNSRQAVEDAAKGLKNTPAQVRLADDVRRAYGQYEAWGPEMRKLALRYTPFLPWSVNAIRFLFDVLPRDHPILTAAIAAADTATSEYRKQHGLDEWTKGHLPSFLLGSIPLPGGAHLRAARYTPFGFASDPTGTIASQVLPQFSGVLDAFNGRDWTGKELKNPDGSPFTSPQKISYGAGQFAQSIIPGLNLLIRTLQAPGSNPASKLAYVENPVRPVKKKSAAASGTKATGSVDWSKADWSQAGAGGVDWSSVDWSKATAP